MNQTEVLAPGGSLAQALRGLEGGADAVYIGYKEFSARSHAENFGLDEISELCKRAQEKSASIYCALNTIMTDSEVERAISTCWELYFRGVKAFIIQDLGLAHALKKFGPPVDLHASTQAVVHRPEGARVMGDLGFSRIVLAREMTLKEIEACVKENPSIEFEVFIHGALCYAASGLCMASGIEIGRSANRGNCGQLCRTWFTTSQEEDIFAASMHDLSLGARIRDLRDIGVISYKIEGRMKPPAYAYWTSLAYKKFLAGDDDKKAYEYLDEARLIFGRNPSTAFLDGPKQESLVNNVFSQSTGISAGEITKVMEGQIEISLKRDLHLGDGLLILHEQGVMKGLKGQRFGVKKLMVHGQEQKKASAGTKAIIETPTQFGEDFKGLEVLLASKHDSKLPELSTRGKYRLPIDLSLSLETRGPKEAVLKVETNLLDGFTKTYSLETEAATNSDTKILLSKIESTFSETGSEFSVNGIKSDYAGPDVFISPRLIKEARRDFYAALAERRQGFALSRALPAGDTYSPPKLKPSPLRSNLSPLKGANKAIGMCADIETLEIEDLPVHEGRRVLTLVPFVLDMEPTLLTAHLPDYMTAVLNFIKDHNGVDFLIGINNIAQVAWMAGLPPRSGSVSYFADYAFHAANRFTIAALFELLPKLEFVVGWLEGNAYEKEGAAKADTSYKPPYFISRACMLRNSLGREKPGCPKNCMGHYNSSLTQGDKKFEVYGSRCITYLVRVEN